MALQIFERARQRDGNRLLVAGRAQVARDADQANDLAGVVAQRKLCRQTPTGPTTGIPVQLEQVYNRPAGTQHALILRRITLRQLGWENVADVAPHQLALFTQSASMDQGLVDD